MPFRTRLGATLAAAGALLGCKSDRPSAGAEAAKPATATVTVTATDFAFEGPAELPAGTVTVKMVNQGKDLHHTQLMKIEDGKTMADVAEALKKPGPPPSWVRFVGGPNAVLPGATAEATSVLEPGHYAYICFVFGADGVIHAAKGMVRPFEVKGETPASAELPTADATIKLVDYDFETSPALTAGRRTILVENGGPQPHELALLKLAPGKTTADFATWAETGMKGPPPAEPIGGVVLLDKGARGTFEVDLTPGDYGLICFVPDAKDGKPHLVHGMMKTIKVS